MYGAYPKEISKIADGTEKSSRMFVAGATRAEKRVFHGDSYDYIWRKDERAHRANFILTLWQRNWDLDFAKFDRGDAMRETRTRQVINAAER